MPSNPLPDPERGEDMDHASDNAWASQAEREKELRDLAAGIRGANAENLSRAAEGASQKYARAVLAPCTKDLRDIAEAVLDEDYGKAGDIFGSVMGSARFRNQKSMLPLYRWLLDRHVTKVSYWDPATDLMASALSTTFRCLTTGGGDTGPLLVAALSMIGTTQAQATSMAFISRFQSRKAIQAIKRRAANSKVSLPSAVVERLALKGAQDVLLKQIRPQLTRHQNPDDPFEMDSSGPRLATVVADPANPQFDRRIEISKRDMPDDWEWEVFRLAAEGSREWTSLALLCFGLISKHSGAVELYKDQPINFQRKSRHKVPIRIRLTDAAYESIANDIESWVDTAFIHAPMICPPDPETGGYLTVPHPLVAGAHRGGQVPMRPMDEALEERKPPYLRTEARGTVQWDEVMAGLAGTPFLSPFEDGTLQILRDVHSKQLHTEGGVEENEAVKDASILETAAKAHVICDGTPRRLHFPVFMDFRGRTYYRPQPWTPQGGDLCKALMRGSREFGPEVAQDPLTRAIMLSSWRGIYGGPEEKLPLPSDPRGDDLSGSTASQERHSESLRPWVQDGVRGGDKPFQCAAFRPDLPSQLYQIDGTCNGLQHLSALALDERGGASVNLRAVDPSRSGPADIYRDVAGLLSERMAGTHVPWANRLRASGLLIDRSLTKRPVMVTPYGGTRPAIQDYALKSALGQVASLDTSLWRDVLLAPGVPDEEARGQNYMAFRDRDLKDHPLFKKDMEKLGSLLYDIIRKEALPKAGVIMDILVRFAKAAGDTAITWRVREDDRSLWPIQAKTIMQKQSVRSIGIHLPSMVQNLTMYSLKTDPEGRFVEPSRVDPQSNATSIVPNFVHSHDADHMARVAGRMAEAGHPFVSVHDCFFTDRLGLKDLYHFTRQEFVAKYERGPGHPLAQPVAFLQTEHSRTHKQDHRWPSWIDAVRDVLGDKDADALAEPGDLDIKEVLDSYWFFC